MVLKRHFGAVLPQPLYPVAVPPGLGDIYVTLTDTDRDLSGGAVIPGMGWPFINRDIARRTEEFDFTGPQMRGYNYGFQTMPRFRSLSGRWGADPERDDTQMFRVRLKWANDIYVADEAAFLEAQGPAAWIALAKTMTKLQDYEGGFRQPFYLIGRPLGSDEAVACNQPFKSRLQQDAAASDAKARATVRDWLKTP